MRIMADRLEHSDQGNDAARRDMDTALEGNCAAEFAANCFRLQLEF
jgi:hypothetical protein